MQIYGVAFETDSTLGDHLSASDRVYTQNLVPESSVTTEDYFASSTGTSEPELPHTDTVSLSHSSPGTLNPEVHSQKLAELKSSISNGTYYVTATAIAGKMIAAAKSSIG